MCKIMILVSFDVSSLFTNVPVSEAAPSFVGSLGKVRHRETGPFSTWNMLQLLKVCLKST